MVSIWRFGYTDPVTADDLDAVFGLSVVANINNNNKSKNKTKDSGVIIKKATKHVFNDIFDVVVGLTVNILIGSSLFYNSLQLVQTDKKRHMKCYTHRSQPTYRTDGKKRQRKQPRYARNNKQLDRPTS